MPGPPGELGGPGGFQEPKPGRLQALCTPPSQAVPAGKPGRDRCKTGIPVRALVTEVQNLLGWTHMAERGSECISCPVSL